MDKLAHHYEDYTRLQQLDQDVGLPAFIVNKTGFLSNLHSLRTAFQSYYPNLRIAYALKANYLPYLVSLVREAEYDAEVVSYMEYQIARRAGFSGDRIVFNGPVKRYAEFSEAILNGSTVNLDGIYEVEMLEQVLRDHPAATLSIGLRVNCSIFDERGESLLYGGRKVGRFGFTDDELSHVIPHLQRSGIRIKSLHGHTSSQKRAVMGYEQIVKRLLSVRTQYNLNIEEFNVGGGFYGPLPKGIAHFATPSFDNYAKAISTILLSDPWVQEHRPTLTIEPGVSVCASSLSYVTKVYNVRQRNGVQLVQVDGTMFHIRPSLGRVNWPYRIISPSTASTNLFPTEIAGSTCMEIDVLLAGEMQEIKRGDFVLIENVGGYSMVMSPAFIQYPANIALFEGEDITLVRDGINFQHIAAPYKWKD